MSWQEIWAVQRHGSKLYACLSPGGDEVGIGITNVSARTGVSNTISLAEAGKLGMELVSLALADAVLEERAQAPSDGAAAARQVDLLDALQEAYRFITQPVRMDTPAGGPKTALYRVERYNQLTDKLRSAINQLETAA